jgi:tRNA pseudouridine38-40 synthase
MAERNIKLILEYDGTRYHGWQRQTGATTIQGLIEEKILIMTKEPVKLMASGRTDAGVHAFNHVCNFITLTRIDPSSFKRGLNALLPDDIFVKQAEDVPIDFHAMYSAESKTYEYRILNQEDPNVFLRLYAWHIPQALELKEMRKCISSLCGEHDFSSFRSTGSGNLNPVRNMMRAEIHEPDKGLLHFVFEANGFLRHMVRNIVGTVVEVGRGKMGVNEFIKVFQARDRREAGVKAPPQGLFLTDVRYPECGSSRRV